MEKSNIQSSNKQIAKNALMLYIRMIFMMLVALYTSRVVLDALGVENYGIYNVVGGFVSLFMFLSSALSSSTQRYITFALGQHDLERLKEVFSTCVLAHIAIAGIIFLFSESVGLWFVMTKLSFPAERMNAALWVYQLSIFSVLIQVISVPYNADIIAHERMSAFAYISIIEALLKLSVAFLIMMSSFDRLVFYAALLLIMQLFIRCMYTYYCRRHFEESIISFNINKRLFLEVFAFSGWNLWGSLSNALSTQGVNIVLNMFFGPLVNAARGVAIQVQVAVQMFANNFQMALNPQITKRYAEGDFGSMHLLMFRSVRFSFLLLFCIVLPIIFFTPTILNIWLKEVPENSVIFVRLMLVIAIIEAMANPFVVAASATGKIKVYQCVMGGLMLGIVPFSYLALRCGGEPYFVYIVHIIFAVFAYIIRLFIVGSLLKLSILQFLKEALFPILSVIFISLLWAFCVAQYNTKSLLNEFIQMLVLIFGVLLTVFLIGLHKNEREFLINKITKS